MDVIDIIKDSFEFPSKNIRLLLIFELLSIVAGAFSIFGTLLYVFGFINPECFMWGGIAVIVSVLIGWVLSGYLISVTKSGIDLDEEAPEFEWWDNFNKGFDYFIVSIVYFIIPAVIVAIVGYLTNIFGNVLVLSHEIISQSANVYMGNSTAFLTDAIAQAIVNLAVSLAITATVAIVLFVIFSFLQTIAGARLANTGSLTDALNIFETAKDITRIGVGKVIVLILLVIVIIAVIEMILSAIYSYIPILSLLSIIITPYLIFFAQRAVGLLYSDIA